MCETRQRAFMLLVKQTMLLREIDRLRDAGPDPKETVRQSLELEKTDAEIAAAATDPRVASLLASWG